MRRNEPPVDWRGKVNPSFVLAIHYLRVIPRFIRALALGGPESAEARTILVEACRESLSLLPPCIPKEFEAPVDFTVGLAGKEENKFLADPAVQQAVSEVAASFRSIPESLLKKGFERPHWWMTQKSWPEFLQKSHVAESILNAWSLLQLNTPLHDLTRRVANGDSDLYAKLFRSENKLPQGPAFDSVIGQLTDEATKIVGRALLLKGEIPGHQLPLRMILYFGWDFGLSDLSIRELHAFLLQMGIIPASYDTEALRKYRDRMRRFIKANTVSRSLPSDSNPKANPSYFPLIGAFQVSLRFLHNFSRILIVAEHHKFGMTKAISLRPLKKFNHGY